MSVPRFLFSFFMLGCSATTVQILILRELLVVLSGNELCIGMALGSWLVGIALGAAVAALFSDKVSQRTFFSVMLAVLPILAALAVAGIRSIRLLLDIPAGEQIPPGYSMLAAVCYAGPLGGVIGLAFPLAAAAYGRVPARKKWAGLRASESASIVYVLESAGSLVAGMLLTFFLLGRFETLPILFWLAVTTGFASHLLTADTRFGWAILVWTVALTTAAASGSDRLVESWSNQRRWSGMAFGNLIRSVETPYQHLDLGGMSGQYNLYGNGGLLFSFPDPYREKMDAHLWMSLHPDPRSVLLIGGLGGRYLPALMEHQTDRIDYVELDAKVVELSRGYDGQTVSKVLRSKSVKLHTTDGRRFVRETGNRYDLVIVAIPDPSTALLNRFYTREFYEEIQDVLAPGGILIIEVEAPGTYLAGEVGAYAASVYWTLRDTFTYVEILPDGAITFAAGEGEPPPVYQPETLVDRLRRRGISGHGFAPESILVKLQTFRMKMVRDALETLGSIGRNSDLSPQSYLRRLILWCREAGSASWARGLAWMESHRQFVLVILLLSVSVPWIFTGLAPKKISLTGCVGAVGCAGMGLELVALYTYQNLYGYLYQEIGLLIAVFMAGLAVGAYAGRWVVRHLSASRALIGLLAISVVFSLLFPAAVWGIAKAELERPVGAPLYSLLILMAGSLVGAVFPVSVAILAGSRAAVVGRPVGLVEAADHLGGALGAFLPGVVLFPLFGVLWTCVILAAGLLCVGVGFLLASYPEGP